jgi:hypothetical protein
MLVENFENLNPSNTYWTKRYNLWSKVDTEGPRYIEFEKWWGGHVNLNAEEIQWIVDQLFVGNKLATAEIVTVKATDRPAQHPLADHLLLLEGRQHHAAAAGARLDPRPLRQRRRHPRLRPDDHLRRARDRRPPRHLRLGGVAKKEHQEFASNIDLIDVLPPGLYEAVMTRKGADSVNQDAISGDWIVASSRAASTTSARSSSPTPRTSAASPPQGGCRRSTSGSIGAWCSRSSRRR